MENFCWSVWGTPTNFIAEELSKQIDEEPVILCIGSETFVEDCLGPLVGTLLKSKGCPCYVYGTLDAPVHSQNLQSAYSFIKAIHPNRKLLVIDASSSRDKARLGKIVLAKNYTPLNHNLKEISLQADWFLFGVCSTHQSLKTLVGTKISVVEQLADAISNAIMKLSVGINV